MFRSRVILCLLFLLTALGSCVQDPVKPDPLDFDTDPRILRGIWVGESEDGHSLVLEAEASSPNEDGYKIRGAFKLDDDAPVAVAGSVSAPVTRTALSTQTSIPCAVIASSADTVWDLCGVIPPEGSPPRLEIGLYRYAREYEQDGTVGYNFSLAKLENTNLLVQGSIIYMQDHQFTHPEAFVFTEDSHAVVRLYYSISALGDGPMELVAETTIEGVSSFPLAYRIAGDPETAFVREGDYFLEARVFSGAGDEAAVGDLLNEFYTPVPGPGAEVEIRVTSLESCDSPGAGGFCR